MEDDTSNRTQNQLMFQFSASGKNHSLQGALWHKGLGRIVGGRRWASISRHGRSTRFDSFAQHPYL